MTETEIKEGRINDQLGSQLESLSAQVEDKIEQGKNSWAEWKSDLSGRSKQMVSDLNEFTRSKPWQALGVAALAGFVLGLVFGKD